MDGHVGVDVGLPGESSLAYFTAVRAFARVGTNVFLEVTLLGKASLTHITFEGTQTLVYHHMFL